MGGCAETTCVGLSYINDGQSKVHSGSIRPKSRLWRACFAMTASALVLLSSHSHKQWGQLGEILGGVRFP